MHDIALTLPADHVSSRPRVGAMPPLGALRSACIYLAFAFSPAFTFAVVGVI
ncbi:hypothetical protein [Mesorhizobium sp.]|uniref:hypothetical protein n=1 Tax=Mesorhizobium sp. TaxID=1871066 RepID=UPI00257EFBBC|nr:hypothetical protein [Mesorhizobium sp.]